MNLEKKKKSFKILKIITIISILLFIITIVSCSATDRRVIDQFEIRIFTEEHNYEEIPDGTMLINNLDSKLPSSIILHNEIHIIDETITKEDVLERLSNNNIFYSLHSDRLHINWRDTGIIFNELYEDEYGNSYFVARFAQRHNPGTSAPFEQLAILFFALSLIFLLITIIVGSDYKDYIQGEKYYNLQTKLLKEEIKNKSEIERLKKEKLEAETRKEQHILNLEKKIDELLYKML